MKFLKRTCPKCGAKVDSVTGDHDELLSFECGSDSPVHGAELSTQSDICKELCELRSKQTPEGAEPLRWSEVSHSLQAYSCLGVLMIDLPGKGNDHCYFFYPYTTPSKGVVFDYQDHKSLLDAAKAHAEELHQAAWREFIEKWGRK